MQKVNRILFVLMLLILTTVVNSNAQSWSSEQKAVWAGVEEYWATGTSSNPMSFLNYFDDSYTGRCI